MRHFWRVRFRLRTLLLAMSILGASPWLVLRCLEWRENQLWNALETAKAQRDAEIANWRAIYDGRQTGDESDAQEAAARSRYFAARAQTELAVKRIHSHYGSNEEALIKAAERRKPRKAQSPVQRMNK